MTRNGMETDSSNTLLYVTVLGKKNGAMGKNNMQENHHRSVSPQVRGKICRTFTTRIINCKFNGV